MNRPRQLAVRAGCARGPDPKVVRRILTHLGLPTEAPVVRPARMLAERGPMLSFGDDDAPAPDDDRWAELGTTEDERAPP